MKLLAVSIALASTIPLLFWVGGMDFERGALQALCTAYFFVVAILSYRLLPLLKKGE